MVIEQMRQAGTIRGQKLREAGGELKREIVEEILRPIATGQISNESQIREKLTAFVVAHPDDPDILSIFGRDTSQYRVLADFFASDLLEMGEQTKAFLADSSRAYELIDQQISIKLANTS